MLKLENYEYEKTYPWRFNHVNVFSLANDDNGRLDKEL